MVEFDVLIQNAKIVEGTNSEVYSGSIGVVGEKIAAIGAVKGDAKKVVDAEGLTALPGFVDAHSHADWTLLWYPRCESYVMQGVTSFVGGQCGGSPGPLGDHVRVPRLLTDYLIELDPFKFYPNKPYYPLDQVNEWMKDIYGWTLDWETMGDYFKRVEEVGISMNYVPLVGHGSIRSKVMGLDYKRHSTEDEQAEMQRLIAEAMDEGCIGMSTGLDYDPDVFATQNEIIDGVKILKKYKGVYCPHWRRTGRRRGIAASNIPNEKITAMMECVDVYKNTDVRLHFAHLSLGWQIYPMPTPELEEANLKATIDMIIRDSKGELDITWDAMPFSMPGHLEVMPYLCNLLTPWLRELGSREALGKWLKVKDFREEVKETIRSGKIFIRVIYNPNTNPRWAENIFVVKSKSAGLAGKSLEQIAKERGIDPWDAYFDIITEDPDTRGVCPRQNCVLEAHERTKCYNQYYTHPAGMVGLDVSVFDDKIQNKNPPYSMPPINTYSAYPLFYIKFVREGDLFTLNEAVQKTATMAARVHNMEGRGILQEGSYADIVLIDLPNLDLLGNELEPRKYPKGIEYVFVNGTTVVEKGKHTGARPGKVLRRE